MVAHLIKSCMPIPFWIPPSPLLKRLGRYQNPMTTTTHELHCRLWPLTSGLLEYSLVAQTVKNLSAMQETQGQYLGREDPLEKVMATHSGILGWRIPWTEEPGRLQSIRSQRIGHNWEANTSLLKNQRGENGHTTLNASHLV